MISDLRTALRVLRRTPLTSGLAVLTLALGIGAAIAIYTVVQGVLLRDLPYASSERLVLIWRGTNEDPQQRGPLSPPDLLDVADALADVANVAGVNSFSTSFLPADAAAEQVALGVVTGDFFGVTGVRPLLGRVLDRSDDRAVDTRTAVMPIVLSHGFWLRHAGGAADVIGRTLRFGGSRMQVVGVMPEEFALYMPVGGGMSTELVGWTPLGLDAAAASRDGAYLKVWARLAPGVTREVVQARLEGIAARLRERHAAHEEAGLRLRAAPLESEVTAHASGVLLLLAVTGIVTLLVACANVAGLLLVQFMGRMQELSVRSALGASRGRIVRQLTAEAALLNVAGACLGIALAAPAVPLLLGLDPGLIPKSWAIRTDAGVFLFAALVAMIATALSGALPALVIARAPLAHIVRSRAAVTRGSRRVRSVAVIGQIAGALLLVYGSVSLADTLRRWQTADYGFDAGGVHTFRLSLPFGSYPGPDAWLQFYGELQHHLTQLPGVALASIGSDLPMAGDLSMEPWLPTDLGGTVSWGARTALHRSVAPGYFEAAGIRLVEGRAFGDADRATASGVAVVDEEIARQLRRDRASSVIGRRIDVTRHLFRGGYSVERTTVEVIGIVATVAHDHPDAPAVGMIYLPHTQYPLWSMFVLLRGAGGRLPDAAQARNAVADLDPSLPLFDERPFERIVADKLAPIRFVLALVILLTIVVSSVAAAGLFGMVAESVRQGRRELGIRLALGASRRRIVTGVLGGGASLLAIGLLGGAALTPIVDRLAARTVGAQTSWSLAALLVAAVLVIGLGLLSCYIPARRAAGIDPLRSLREE